MKIVIDTNIIFSILISNNSKLNQIFNSENPKLFFYAPEFLINEIEIHFSKIVKISKLTELEIRTAWSIVQKNITFVSTDLILNEIYIKAEKLVFNIDPKDVEFVALALELDCFLWSGDKKLRDGVKQKGFDKIINANELYALINPLLSRTNSKPK